MIEQSTDRTRWPDRLTYFALLLFACAAAVADTPGQTTSDPGYLPEQYHVLDIVRTWNQSSVAVLPTVIRRTQRTAHSFASQHQIVGFLTKKGVAATAKPLRIDLGPARRPSQWEIFRYGAERVADAAREYAAGTDYVLVMELLVPDYQSVFGIEIYIVDAGGRHMLSFLLNEHHEIFADANLVASDSSEEARAEMIAAATRIGLQALDRQLAALRQRIEREEGDTAPAVPGTIHDFQSDATLAEPSI